MNIFIIDVLEETEADMNIVSQLQHQVDQLREKIKLQNIEINSKNSEINNVSVK